MVIESSPQQRPALNRAGLSSLGKDLLLLITILVILVYLVIYPILIHFYEGGCLQFRSVVIVLVYFCLITISMKCIINVRPWIAGIGCS